MLKRSSPLSIPITGGNACLRDWRRLWQNTCSARVLKDLQQQKHAVETDLPQQRAQLTAADNQVVSAQNEEQQASTQWERERPIIAQVRTLDQKLNGIGQALTDKQQQRAGVSERLSQRNTELTAKETALTDLHKQQAQQQDYLSNHEQDAFLANNDYGLAGFGRDAGELKNSSLVMLSAWVNIRLTVQN